MESKWTMPTIPAGLLPEHIPAAMFLSVSAHSFQTVPGYLQNSLAAKRVCGCITALCLAVKLARFIPTEIQERFSDEPHHLILIFDFLALPRFDGQCRGE